MKTKLSALPAGALAAILACTSAHAAGSWVTTSTLRHENPAAVMKEAMMPGESVHVALSLQIHDKAGLDAVVAGLAAGRSTHRVTPAEFLSHYAPTVAEAASVATYLRQSGFTRVQVARNRMLVTADGTAATARKAFNADLRHFAIDGRDAYANVADAQVPAHLGGLVGAVLGLQTVSQAHSMMKRPSAAGAAAVTGQRLTHDASDFSTLYGADSLPPAADSTIAIVAVGSLYLTLNDLASYATMKGYPAVDAQVILPAGPADNYYDWEEWSMDSQASLGAAGGQVKQMLFYDVPDYSDASLSAAFNAAVADNRAQTISVSIGECELYAQASGFQAASDLTFEIAIAQGQTFAFATGDSGSWQCGKEFNGSTYPAVSPWVMAVGGTTLITENDLVTYVNEKTWSCRNREECVIAGGTGGGKSVTEKIPSWQIGVVVGRKGDIKMRSIPDVAFDADPYTGLNLWDHGAVDGPIGGTSLATPIFAGLWARIQSAHANSLGFPGMGLYGLHETDAGVFHDVTFGKNGGYRATPGWDAVTGFGSFDAARLSAFIDANPGAFGHGL